MPNYRDDAQHEHDQKKVFRDWMDMRIAAIHSRVSAADVLTRYGVKLRYSGGRPEQIFCPFHGNTRTMAARYHPADVRNSDHVFCFVCGGRPWDCIELYRRFENLTGDKFSTALRSLERAYGIVPPEAPSESPEDEADDSERVEIETEFAAAEFRLKKGKNAFDMRGYLVVGSILDRLRWQYDNGKVLPSMVLGTLRKVFDKIGEKVRACPGD